jgi:T5orf172 domain
MPVVRSHGFHQRVVSNPSLLAPGAAATVYAIWDGEAVKIGNCRGHPATRMADLQTGNPRPLILLAWTTTLTERQAHTKLRSEHFRGEWFRLSEKVLAEVRTWDWLAVELEMELRQRLSE